MKTIYKARYRLIIQQIIDHRKSLNMTQQEIADKLMKPQSYMAKIKRFERKLDILAFVEICEVVVLSPAKVLENS